MPHRKADFVAQDTYPVELTAPDIEPYRAGNTGIDYVTSWDSGRPGPHAMVNAVTHGNELCGAIAVDLLLREGIRPRRGRLTLGFANVAAYRAFDPRTPTASRFVDEDFNRVWDETTLGGPRHSVELARARQMRPLIDTVDYLLDIHSMQHATEPLMMVGLLDKSVDLARRVGVPATIVRDAGHASGRRLRDYGGFGDARSPKTALLAECGQHWERRAAALAIETAFRFLAALGMIEAATVARYGAAGSPPPQRVIRVTDAVTIASDRFEFVRDFRGMEVLPQAGTLLGRDGDREVRTPYDNCVLIMPSPRLSRGQTAVRLGRYEA
jgi:predicted deacylase